MIATTPALLVQPDGQVDEIVPDNATALVVDFPES